MRRAAIVEAIKDGITQNFPEDVAEVFDLADLDNMAKLIQERNGIDNESDVRNLFDYMKSDIDDRTLDWLADGECDNPNAWLYRQIQDL